MKTKTKKRKDKKAVERAPEVGLCVLHDGYQEVTQEADPNNEWDRGSTSTSWTVGGIVLASKKDMPDLTACFPVKAGDTVHVVFAVYSSGDSFGQDEHGNIEFIDVYKTAAKAARAAKAVRGHANWYRDINDRWSPMTAKERRLAEKTYDNLYHVDVVREDGSQKNIYASWNGYFESLSYVEVATFVVDANKRSRF